GGLFSLHEHGYGDDQARLVRQRDVPLTDSELVAHDPTALGPDDLRSSPGIRHNARIANPHPVRESGSHRLHDGFLGCKAHGEKTHRSRALAKPLQLGRQQQSLHEPLTVALVNLADPFELDDVGSDPEDHDRAAATRASSIRRFISATAAAMPSMTARATMA